MARSLGNSVSFAPVRLCGRSLSAVAVAAIFLMAFSGCASTEQDNSPKTLRVTVPPAAPADLIVKVADVIGSNVVETGSQCLSSAQTSGINEAVGLVDAAGEYVFDPSEFTYDVGQAVQFTLTAQSEFHTFTVDSLGIDCSVEAGETVIFNFTFDSPGTFPLVCIPHESQGMKGFIKVN